MVVILALAAIFVLHPNTYWCYLCSLVPRPSHPCVSTASDKRWGEKAWEPSQYLWCYVHALGLDSVHAMNPAGQQCQLDVYFCYQVYLCYKTGIYM